MVLKKRRCRLLSLLLWLDLRCHVYSWILSARSAVVAGQGLPGHVMVSPRGWIAPSSWQQRLRVAASDQNNDIVPEPTSSATPPTTIADDDERDKVSANEKEDLEPTVSSLRELYPPSEAYENGTLQVDSIHSIYYEVHGNNNSGSHSKKEETKTALFLHGGPGAG